MISMLRGCRPSERTALLGSVSFSSTSTSTSCSRNSLASIIPVGPPPLMITSDMSNPHPQLSSRPAAPNRAIRSSARTRAHLGPHWLEPLLLDGKSTIPEGGQDGDSHLL